MSSDLACVFIYTVEDEPSLAQRKCPKHSLDLTLFVDIPEVKICGFLINYRLYTRASSLAGRTLGSLAYFWVNCDAILLPYTRGMIGVRIRGEISTEPMSTRMRIIIDNN